MDADGAAAAWTRIGRRGFLAASLTTMGLALVAKPVLANPSSTRSLSLYNPNRLESLTIQYCADGWYNPDSLLQVNQFMRDPPTDEVIAMDPQLLDILFQLQQRAGASEPINVCSGYRSPATNASMRVEHRGVARNSYHMYGRAVDFRIPGHNLVHVRDIALSLQAGGVGYYGRSDFIHVDTGPVRAWRA